MKTTTLGEKRAKLTPCDAASTLLEEDLAEMGPHLGFSAVCLPDNSVSRCLCGFTSKLFNFKSLVLTPTLTLTLNFSHTPHPHRPTSKTSSKTVGVTPWQLTSDLLAKYTWARRHFCLKKTSAACPAVQCSEHNDGLEPVCLCQTVYASPCSTWHIHHGLISMHHKV